jgi:hypothetical protein
MRRLYRQLADYLRGDRSAVSAELSKMKAAGLINHWKTILGFFPFDLTRGFLLSLLYDLQIRKQQNMD